MANSATTAAVVAANDYKLENVIITDIKQERESGRIVITLNTTFKSIVGPLIKGGANIIIDRISAEKCSNIYDSRGNCFVSRETDSNIKFMVVHYLRDSHGMDGIVDMGNHQ